MTSVFGDVFTEVAVLLLVAAVIGAIGVRLRQPLIVAFISWLSPCEAVSLVTECKFVDG